MAQSIGLRLKRAVRPAVLPLLTRLRQRQFPGSRDYWEDRYAAGETSGDGSYGVLAQFKADVLNAFVREHDVQTVMEFGCGDGNQLTLADYPTYLGLDVAPTSIDMCRKLFANDPAKSFYLYDTRRFVDNARIFHADLTLSLDVIYHLVEDEVFEGYLRHLFAAADRNVIVYATNSPIPDIGVHVRHRHFTPWIETNLPDWRLTETIENAHPDKDGRADFFVYERVT